MKTEKGFTLVEILVSMAVFSLIVLIVLGSLQTLTGVVSSTDTREEAKNLAEKQMEYVKGLPFAGSYSPKAIDPEYSGFSCNISTSVMEDINIQKVIVAVNWGGKQITTLEGFKVK